MSFVVLVPDALASAAVELARIGSGVTAANAAYVQGGTGGTGGIGAIW